MKQVIRAIDLARYVISQANYSGYSVTHLKLQKLLYYIQGKYLAKNHTPLFIEQIEAWPYGPVVPDVYYAYVSNGALNLQSEGRPIDCEPNWTERDRIFVDKVLEEKLPFSPSALVRATHREDPWLQHKDEVECGERPIISTRSMERFFSGEQK